MALALAEKTSTKDTRKDKRGLVGYGYGLGYGGFNAYTAAHYPTVGISSYSAQYPSIDITHGVSTVVTKEVAVPVPHPVPVTVEKHVPVPVKVISFESH